MAKDRRIGPFYHGRPVFAGALVLGLLACTPAEAPPRGAGPAFVRPETLHRLDDGRLLVADPGVGVLAVDPVSGDRAVLQAGTGYFDAVPFDKGYALAGNGKVSWLNARGRLVDLATGLEAPSRLAVLPDGALAVLDDGRLLQVEEGRARAVPVALDEPADLLATGPGRVLVAEETLGRLREIDLATGRVTRTFDLQDEAGPPVLEPGGLGPGATAGEVLVADTLTAEVTALDLATGARSSVSRPGKGSGVLLPQVQDAVALEGGVAVLYPRRAALVRVSGAMERTVLSGPALPEGSQPLQPLGVAVLRDGTPVVLDWTERQILVLDSPRRARLLRPDLRVPIALAAHGRRLFVLDRRAGLLEVDLVSGSGKVLVQRPLPGLAMALAADSTRVVAVGMAPPALAEVPLDGGPPRARDLQAAPAGVAILPDGALLLTDFLGGRVLRLPGGEVAKVRRPWAIAVDPSGGAVVGDNDQEALLWLEGGGTRVLTRTGEPPGPPLQGVQALALEKDGAILVADPGGGGLLRVDPGTGAREPVPVDAGSH